MQRSKDRHPENWRSYDWHLHQTEGPQEAEGGANERETKAVPQEEPNNVSALSTQRHADTNLFRALGG